MAMLTKPSAAAKMALAYITIGALMIVWTGVWFAWIYQHAEPHQYKYYLCTALMLTGITLLVIGLGLGRIGRAARKAEMPPPEATAQVAQADRLAAQTGAPSPENPQVVAPGTIPPPTPVQAVPVARPTAAGTPLTPR